MFPKPLNGWKVVNTKLFGVNVRICPQIMNIDFVQGTMEWFAVAAEI